MRRSRRRGFVRAQYGQTPLSWAAQKGHVPVVRLLLERGAVVDAKDKVRRPVVPRSVGGRAAKHSGNAPFVATVSAAPPDPLRAPCRRRSRRLLTADYIAAVCASERR